MYVCVKIEFFKFLNFEILHSSEFGFLIVCLSSFLFVILVLVLNFGDDCSIILTFFAPGNGVSDVSS